jgi:RNA polymerase sigma factor (TIGR02999 family)
MADESSAEITLWLRAWSAGDQAALNRLAPLVYEELHRVARRYMRRERPGHTLQTTALVNEAYLRLMDVTSLTWRDRAHFFAVAADMMRRILVNAARARLTGKRGGRSPHMQLDEGIDAVPERPAELVALDAALDALKEIDPRKSRVVELRCFGELSVEETAEVLKISPQSVLRDWKLAKAWLARELS